MTYQPRFVLAFGNTLTFLGGMALLFAFMWMFAPVFHSVLWCLVLMARGE